MTGNISIHSATWATICGDIVFSLNFKREKYRLSIGDGMRLSQIEGNAEHPPRTVSRDEVLTLLRQGDDAMWNWMAFMYMWQGWADGFKNGKQSST